MFTNSEGQVTISAGKYINRNTYIELKKDLEGPPKAVINLDIGRGLRLRGGVGADGESSAGIIYEKNY